MARTAVTYNAGTWDVAGVTPSTSPITVTDAALSTSDITTNNASTTKHGFAPKYPNDATKYLDGTGAYTVPPGTGGGGITADMLPWLIDIDVFPTALANTTWNTISIDAGALYGGDKRTAGAQNSSITWNVVLAAGTWDIEIISITSNNRGIYTVKFDATTVGTIDGYSAGFASDVRASVTGIAVATTAKIALTLIMATKNASSSSYFGILQHVRLQRTA